MRHFGDCVECESVRVQDALALGIACLFPDEGTYTAIGHRHCQQENLKKMLDFWLYRVARIA